MSNRKKFAKIAIKNALKPFHGNVMAIKSNLWPIISFFPKWSLKKADKMWCAAFVYYCCIKAGYKLLIKYPHPKVRHRFSACSGWEQWAKLKQNKFYFKRNNPLFIPQKGDIVLYNGVFDPGPHDHIGIIIENRKKSLQVAEGNVNNLSVIIKRPKNSHIRGYIRIPDGYNWKQKKICE